MTMTMQIDQIEEPYRQLLADGFRRHEGTGLLVPEEVSREREVWLREDWKTVDRATKFLTSKGLTIFFGCKDKRCQKAAIERIANLDGTVTLRCAHKDRILRKDRR